jgi:hypothetical protein
LDDAGWLAYSHYLECKAVNWQCPDALDPVVRRNAALIRSAEDEAASIKEQRRLIALATSLRPRG